MERSEIIKELEQYYNQEGIIPPPGQFACRNLNRCRSRSDLARGMQCHIGEKYGTKMKVLVASMDCGNGGADNISTRSNNVKEYAKGPLNPHMRGTYQALSLFYDEKEPRNLVHYMAMTNTCKCCRKGSPNHMTIGFYKRCREHSLKEIKY